MTTAAALRGGKQGKPRPTEAAYDSVVTGGYEALAGYASARKQQSERTFEGVSHCTRARCC